MPRSVYYQDVGNPIQPDRLPATRPIVALAHLAASTAEALAMVGNIGVLLEAVLLVTTFSTRHMTLPQGLNSLVFYSLLVLSIAIVCALTHTGWRVFFGLLICSAVGLGLIPRTTLAQLLFLSAVALGLLAWQFGRHWTAICTASPLDRQTAQALHKSWILPLALPAAVPTIVVVLAFSTGIPLLAGLILVLFLFVQTFSTKAPDAPNKLRVVCDAVVSWCTYNRIELSLPGLLRSPAGKIASRVSITCLYMFLVVSAWTLFSQHLLAVPSVSTSEQSSASKAIGAFVLWNLALFFTAISLPLLLVLPVLVDAARWRRPGVQSDEWHELVNDLQHSPDHIESRSYYMGRVATDGSPLLVPRQVFCEHAHFLGDSGTGKTSLGLAPWIEQTVNFGDCSIVVVDLKADSVELLATLTAAAEAVRQRTGRRIPLRYFTNQSHLSTYGFNPLTQPYWDDFDPYIKTDILCGAAGLLYGADYGAGWYSAANAAVLHYTIKNFPDVRTFRELAERVNYTLTSAKKKDLHPELRAAGVHVQAILDRLGAFEALNVATGTGFPDEVVQQAVDLSDVFRRPQILYFHLSSTLAAGSSPEIARLLAYSLLCASTQTQRRHQVFLVIDEFQRMVAHNVEYMLQLARSMGVGVILANQSMQDLGDLIPAIEANCRYRQWFSVSSIDDRKRLIAASGETVELFTSRSHSESSGGGSSDSTSVREQVMPRLSSNDIVLMGDHPMRSILTITRGSGYAQYGGFSLIAESSYHISAAEYQRRRMMPWPAPAIGTFIPKQHRKQTAILPQLGRPGPIVTTEIIGDFGLGGALPLLRQPQPRPGKGPEGRDR